MNIAVLSDTHLLKNTGQLDNLTTLFRDADLVIHAGDYGGIWVIDYLQANFNFAGVWGNTDDDAIKSRLPEKEVITLGQYRAGVCHGHGTGKTTIERAYTSFASEQVDIIIFGHSHQPVIHTKNKVLMLNPGSMTSKRQERWFSYIMLTVTSTSIKAQIMFF
ncbi:metallophosphoesterase [Sporomusa aerivorans]|uniref:metallophosphoesterase family protein n=1 Tax=Sporomusa aerivorans TaxID=204936 RepID=UPI00352A07AC